MTEDNVHDESNDELVDNGSEGDEGGQTTHYRLNRDLKKRLDKYLQDRILHMSRTQLQRLIREKAVTVNGRHPKASTILRQGDEIIIVVPPPQSKDIPAEDIPLDVLFEDEHIIIINKQAGIIVHPARSHLSGTIINALAYHFQHHSDGSLSTVGKEDARPGVVHRLDKDTTGVLIAAKTDVAHWRIGKQFQERTVEKHYLAVVAGNVEPQADMIDLPLGKHPTERELMAVRYDENAKHAQTIYRVEEQFSDAFALLDIRLLTGRTHQIRVHLSHLGWPIVGDDQYGGPLLNIEDIQKQKSTTSENQQTGPLMHRQALHAHTIEFNHPITEKRLHFKAPLPEDIQELLTALRTG